MSIISKKYKHILLDNHDMTTVIYMFWSNQIKFELIDKES